MFTIQVGYRLYDYIYVHIFLNYYLKKIHGMYVSYADGTLNI